MSIKSQIVMAPRTALSAYNVAERNLKIEEAAHNSRTRFAWDPKSLEKVEALHAIKLAALEDLEAAYAQRRSVAPTAISKATKGQ